MRNRLHGSEIYLVNVKSMKTIAQIFVAFSEKLNFANLNDDPQTLLFIVLGIFNFAIFLLCFCVYLDKNSGYAQGKGSTD